MIVVTPSVWLANLVKQSFLGEYPIKVINNGIDLEVFVPTVSNFKEKHCIQDKKIVLAVAFEWGYGKGIDVISSLAKMLPDKYQVVVVGSDEKVEKDLPTHVIAIRRTNNQKELAEIYTVADVFINPTREEVLGLTNIESLACGTPVITFRTGGSPECIDDTCGCVVNIDDVEMMKEQIIRICDENPYSIEDCIYRAKQFDKNERLKDYIELYSSMEGEK